jgi:hypothetical protein
MKNVILGLFVLLGFQKKDLVLTTVNKMYEVDFQENIFRIDVEIFNAGKKSFCLYSTDIFTISTLSEDEFIQWRLTAGFELFLFDQNGNLFIPEITIFTEDERDIRGSYVFDKIFISPRERKKFSIKFDNEVMKMPPSNKYKGYLIFLQNDHFIDYKINKTAQFNYLNNCVVFNGFIKSNEFEIIIK